jgi:hypothetical protein
MIEVLSSKRETASNSSATLQSSGTLSDTDTLRESFQATQVPPESALEPAVSSASQNLHEKELAFQSDTTISVVGERESRVSAAMRRLLPPAGFPLHDLRNCGSRQTQCLL